MYTHTDFPHVGNRLCPRSEDSYSLAKLAVPARDFALSISQQPCGLSGMTLRHSFCRHGVWNSDGKSEVHECVVFLVQILTGFLIRPLLSPTP